MIDGFAFLQDSTVGNFSHYITKNDLIPCNKPTVLTYLFTSTVIPFFYVTKIGLTKSFDIAR